MKRIVASLFFLLTGSAFAQPTYTGDVAPIIQEKCQRCHRQGDIAPFAMTNYEDTSIWAEDIARVVKGRIMPPWKPVEGFGEFRDNFGLTDAQRQILVEWAEAGAPQGDAAAPAPAAPTSSEWELGDPDKVIQMPVPFDVTRGKDIYRCFVLPTGLDENKWIDAVQIVPGNRNVVHHVILYVDTTGTAEKLDGKDGMPGYSCVGGPGIDFSTANLDSLGMLGGWVPGARTQRLPEGVGLGLPKGSKIVMQVHYYPGGRPGPDQTKLGLYYKPTPVARQLRFIPVLNTSFRIPAGSKDFEVKASMDVPFFLSAKVWQIVPHMHLLGRQIKVELQNRDKSMSPMIFIDDWDFNWQNFYFYEKPVSLPAQSTVRVSCRYDNSADNPKNPSNPLKTVGWGEGTEDEMCIGFLGVTFDQENLLPSTARVTK